MRKIMLAVFFCIVVGNVSSQTYKLETVFSELNLNYLSHWKALDDKVPVKVEAFSLWGYQTYADNWTNNAYEVEYYKGSAEEMYLFLDQVIKFTQKYKSDDKVVTFIAGVQVKTLVQLGFKYTLVYDKERKVVCKYNERQWSDILYKFVSYCEKQQINY